MSFRFVRMATAIALCTFAIQSLVFADDSAAIVKRVKSATAIVDTGTEYRGAAFCVGPDGLFLTSTNNLDGVWQKTPLRLVFDAGEKDERRVPARVVRTDMATGLALLRAPDANKTPLDLGVADDAYETAPVTIFGYPTGIPRIPETVLPDGIRTTVTRIAGFKRIRGEVRGMQFEASRLDRGFSGAAVVNTLGQVLGMIATTSESPRTVSAALPVSEILKFLDVPSVDFEVQFVDEPNCRELRKFPLFLVGFKEPVGERKVIVEFSEDGQKPRIFETKVVAGNAYEFEGIPVENKDGPFAKVTAEFSEGALSGTCLDRELMLGDRKGRLSDYREVVVSGSSRSFSPLDGTSTITLEGAVMGLLDIPVNFGGLTATIDLNKATRIQFSPLEKPIPDVKYRVIVKDAGQPDVERTGELKIISTQFPPAAKSPPAPSTTTTPRPTTELLKPGTKVPQSRVANVQFNPPPFKHGPVEVLLPAPAVSIRPGAGGRLLIIHLAKLRQLAVFDISRLEIVKYLPLDSDDITYCAGAEKLFIGYRSLGIIERWDLNKLERELRAPSPSGGVRELSIGVCSLSPLILLAPIEAKKSWLLDPITFSEAPIKWKGWENGAWGPYRTIVSYDGSTVLAYGGGWGGWESASFTPDGFSTIYFGGHTDPRSDQEIGLISGDGSLIFPTNGTIASNDGTTRAEMFEGLVVPTLDPAFTLFVRSARDQPATLCLVPNSSPDTVITLGKFDELVGPVDNEHRPRHQGISTKHLVIPHARVAISLVEQGTKLLARPFDLFDALKRTDIDYFFVESTPERLTAPGQQYRYPILVKSQKAPVQFSLESGPAGMAISDDGELVWNVPRDFAQKKVSVIVAVTDGIGRKLFHSFQIHIGSVPLPRAVSRLPDILEGAIPRASATEARPGIEQKRPATESSAAPLKSGQSVDTGKRPDRPSGLVPLYRFYNKKNFKHTYTTNVKELEIWRANRDMEDQGPIGMVALEGGKDTVQIARSVRPVDAHLYRVGKFDDIAFRAHFDPGFNVFAWADAGDSRVPVYSSTWIDGTDFYWDTEKKALDNYSNGTRAALKVERIRLGGKELLPLFYVYPFIEKQ
jgi:hypothetical protein